MHACTFIGRTHALHTCKIRLRTLAAPSCWPRWEKLTYLLTYSLACLLAYLLTVLLAKVRDAYFVTY